MIDVSIEKKLKLTAQDMYDICDFATQAAYDDGFMNSYIFERASLVFAAIRLYQDRADEITSLAAKNINTAWTALLEDGTLDDMINNYKQECDYLCSIGEIWFDDYTKYAQSARGLLNTIQTFTGDLVSSAAEQFKQINENGEVQEVLQIADKWGLGGIAQEEPETLFED